MTDANAATVVVDEHDRLRLVTISNITKRNALTRAMLTSLAGAFSPAGGDVRAIVVRGDPAGGAFSSGFDITSIDDERARGLDPIDDVASAIEASPVPG